MLVQKVGMKNDLFKTKFGQKYFWFKIFLVENNWSKNFWVYIFFLVKLLGQNLLRHMLPGQMLPGKISLGQLCPIKDDHRNIPLKFCQKRMSNIWHWIFVVVVGGVKSNFMSNPTYLTLSHEWLTIFRLKSFIATP